MKHSLYLKFLLGYLIFGILGFLTISTFSQYAMKQHIVAESADTMYDEARLIAGRCSNLYQGSRQDSAAVYQQIQAVAEYVKGEIWIVDRQGTVVYDSRAAEQEARKIASFNPTAAGNRHYSVGDYFGQFQQEVISVSAPITGNYQTYGYVVIHQPMSLIEDRTFSALNVFYISAFVLFLLSLILMIVFAVTVYFPLMKITEGASKYAQGDLTWQIKVDSHDEMGYLAATLNYMSDELNKMEEYQKSFVANVSHDFRSPLTSIKGYLEAIIDGTIPPELQEKYLQRVISETDRLNKLTEGILTLNSLESKGFLNRSNFDINRVIKDTAASFEGICHAKDVTFDLTFSDAVLMVRADVGKIQRVLYNLIDNAIKFSSNGSVIYIQTYTRHEKIYVSVKDTGIGIPKDSIQKIWERFYKTDLSRGKDKKGTGLGLSIVKEIIQAHDENIDVISTVGVGTEFIFTLPRATAEQ